MRLRSRAGVRWSLVAVGVVILAAGGWVARAEFSHSDTRSNKEALADLIRLKEREEQQRQADREAIRKLCLAGKIAGDDCVKVGLPPRQERTDQ